MIGSQPRSRALLQGVFVAILVALASSSSSAQSVGAIPQFSTVETHTYDTVNLGTLGIQLNVPIRSKAGHIPYSFRLAGAAQITTLTANGILVSNGYSNGNYTSAGGFLFPGESHLALALGYTTTTTCWTGVNPRKYNGQYFSGFYAIDALGIRHPFGFIVSGSPSPGQCYYGENTEGGYAEDDSGLYLKVTSNGVGITTYSLIDPSGNVQTPLSGPTSIADPNGNTLTASVDTLGQTVLTESGSAGNYTFSWKDALNNQRTATLASTTFTMFLTFGCSGDWTTTASVPFPTSVSFPDNSSMSIGWEVNPLHGGDYTGRIASITLPTGGTISYEYSGGTNGINCQDGSPATMKRVTPDGTWTYTHTPSGGQGTTNQTTVTDPSGNDTVYTFEGSQPNPLLGTHSWQPLEVERQVYSGSSNLIETVLTCYNSGSSPTNCNPSAPSYLITEKDIYTTYPGVTGYSALKTSYDDNGRVTEVQSFDFNASTATSVKLIQYGTGSPSSQSCATIGSNVIDKPCSVTLEDGSGHILTQTWNSYDTHGNLTQTWNLVSGSGSSGTYLTKQFAYNSSGVMTSSTDVNGEVTIYNPTSCNNMFATSQYPQDFPNLETSQTWDCNGGVTTSTTDANGQTTSTFYSIGTTADPFYRPMESEDPLGNKTYLTYTPTTTDTSLAVNGGQSVVETLSTSDDMGRNTIAQVHQGPSSSNWDSRSRSFDDDGRAYQNSLPCATSASSGCSASTESQTYDGLNRPLVHTGTGGDVVTKTYAANDVKITLTPAPSGENAKATQKEYDGLGRLKSVCIISGATGSASCGQTTSATGFLTKYTYDGAGRLLQVTENAQASSPQQVRSYSYDLTGRVLTETNPESGTVQYTYDSVSGSNCTSTSIGDLVQKIDANGNTTCFQYDKMHRNTSIAYAGPNSNGVNKHFVFDSATVNGAGMSYAEGHMAEAYTCSGSCSTKITDEGFGYDQRGSMSAYYQSSPNSGGYYNLSATYWEDKGLKTVNGVGLPTITYTGLDGEARVTSVTAGSTSLVSNVVYNSGSYGGEPIGALLQVALGSGDSQNFTYDPNTGRMTQYQASVGATPVTISGSLAWNANGTLASNNIVDGYNSADTQNCSYSYDDFIRAASVNCLNGSTKVWNQTFTYGSDAFGNITKTSTGPGLSWMPMYNTANNQYTQTGTQYDSDGDLLADSFHNYTWLADGHVATVATGGTTATVTYDALGNKVEENIGGVIHEYVSAFGVSAQMSGQTENSTTINLPGGVQALFSSGTLQRYRFPDWEGTVRAESNPAARQFTESLAFAPFGERYALQGAPYNVDTFTGKPNQIVSDEYDFEARELHNGQGRWISPDPMRGTGNKYVYADNNPLSKVDILGLFSAGFGGLPDFDGDGSSDDNLDYITFVSESGPVEPTETDGSTPSTDSESGQSNTGGGDSQPVSAQNNQQQQQSPGQQAQAQAQQQSGQQGSNKPTNQPVDPVPTGADGKPTPPPIPVPGCAACSWVWSPDKNNSRGGRWVPDNYPKTPGGIPGASWDPGSRGGPGHWDVDHGNGTRTRHYPDGSPMPDDVAHPPGWRPIWSFLNDQWQGFKNYLRDHPYGPNSSPGPWVPSPMPFPVPVVP